jgi:hypothetical protein
VDRTRPDRWAGLAVDRTPRDLLVGLAGDRTPLDPLVGLAVGRTPPDRLAELADVTALDFYDRQSTATCSEANLDEADGSEDRKGAVENCIILGGVYRQVHTSSVQLPETSFARSDGE